MEPLLIFCFTFAGVFRVYPQIYIQDIPMVAVAQLVRAPDCGSGGRGFETHQPPITEIHLVLIYNR